MIGIPSRSEQVLITQRMGQWYLYPMKIGNSDVHAEHYRHEINDNDSDSLLSLSSSFYHHNSKEEEEEEKDRKRMCRAGDHDRTKGAIANDDHISHPFNDKEKDRPKKVGLKRRCKLQRSESDSVRHEHARKHAKKSESRDNKKLRSFLQKMSTSSISNNSNNSDNKRKSSNNGAKINAMTKEMQIVHTNNNQSKLTVLLQHSKPQSNLDHYCLANESVLIRPHTQKHKHKHKHKHKYNLTFSHFDVSTCNYNSNDNGDDSGNNSGTQLPRRSKSISIPNPLKSRYDFDFKFSLYQ
ncbi:hypothetical protein RFI_01775, partial [Reticulomyxa filosa]